MTLGHRPAVLMTAILVVLAAATPARASPGDLDPGFGVAGTTLIGFPAGFDAYFADLAVQPDGMIVVLGDLQASAAGAPLPPPLSPKTSGEGLVIVRLTADGQADGSFGDGGVVAVGGSERALDVVIDDQSRIVASGVIPAADGGRAISVIRLLPNGSLDPSFGSGGRVTTRSTGADTWAAAIQPDGKIVAAGRLGHKAELRRYEADGSVDRTFGLRGRVSVPRVREGFTDVELLPDGRLLAVGGALDSTILIARFDADGSLDQTFAGDGTRRTGFGHFPASFPIILGIDGGGRVVVMVGEVFVPAFGLAVYTSNGQLDRTFRGRGTAIVKVPEATLGSVAGTLQADGKIVVTTADLSPGGDLALGFGLHRLLPTGRADPSFGRGGRVFTDFEATDDLTSNILPQTDGRLVVAGISWLSDGSSGLRVARYLAD